MDTAWIQVFVLTLSECVAPAGKTICQEQAFELQFLTRADCEVALEQLLTLKEASDNVIVNPERSACAPAARERPVFASLDELRDGQADGAALQVLEEAAAEPSATLVAHQERLASLKTCEATKGVAPCKVGEIIMEGAREEASQIWKSD